MTNTGQAASQGNGRKSAETRIFSSGILIGLALGLIIGWGMPRLLSLRRSKTAVATVATKPPKPAPPAQPTLQFVVRESPFDAIPGKGLLVSSALPANLLENGEAERARQRDKAVFMGFRNWSNTVESLTNGRGDLVLRMEKTRVVTGWTAEDYQKLIKGQPLQVRIASGRAHTLLFSTSDRREIALGTFRLGDPAPSATPTNTPGATPSG